jgi:hypothetical protein
VAGVESGTRQRAKRLYTPTVAIRDGEVAILPNAVTVRL